MTATQKQFEVFFRGLVVLQGVLLLIIGITVSSINLPFSALRIDSAFVIASGLIVFAFGLASWKLPIAAAMIMGSSVATMIAVFAFGYRPIEAGDVSFQPDLKIRPD